LALGAGGLGRAAPFTLTQRDVTPIGAPSKSRGASWLSASRAASAASSLPLRCRRRCPLWSHLPRLRRPRCPHRFREAASPRFDQVHAAPPPRGPPQSCATPPSALRGHRRGHRAPDCTPPPSRQLCASLGAVTCCAPRATSSFCALRAREFNCSRSVSAFVSAAAIRPQCSAAGRLVTAVAHPRLCPRKMRVVVEELRPCSHVVHDAKPQLSPGPWPASTNL